jgi:hypothetical protein
VRRRSFSLYEMTFAIDVVSGDVCVCAFGMGIEQVSVLGRWQIQKTPHPRPGRRFRRWIAGKKAEKSDVAMFHESCDRDATLHMSVKKI